MDFYYLSASAPCRSVLMAAKALNVKLNHKPLSILEENHLKMECPQKSIHYTIPTLIDKDVVRTKSRVILAYLVDKYGKNNSIYPKDTQKQHVVSQRLYFDQRVLYKSFLGYYAPQIFHGISASTEEFKIVESAFRSLNRFLDDQEFVAGSKLTIADIAILATVSTFVVMDFELNKYPNVDRWYQNAQKVTPGWDENWACLMKMKQWISFKKHLT